LGEVTLRGSPLGWRFISEQRWITTLYKDLTE
jgi:hypothetical protein